MTTVQLHSMTTTKILYHFTLGSDRVIGIVKLNDLLLKCIHHMRWYCALQTMCRLEKCYCISIWQQNANRKRRIFSRKTFVQTKLLCISEDEMNVDVTRIHNMHLYTHTLRKKWVNNIPRTIQFHLNALQIHAQEFVDCCACTCYARITINNKLWPMKTIIVRSETNKKTRKI